MPIFLLSSCNVQYDTSRGFSSAVHHPETNLFYLSSADASFVFLLLYLYVRLPRSTDEPLGSVFAFYKTARAQRSVASTLNILRMIVVISAAQTGYCADRDGSPLRDTD